MSKAFHANITITPEESPYCFVELSQMLAESRKFQYAEIWVGFGKFPTHCALVNDGLAWMMCLRYDGDAGFSTRNPKYAGPVDAVLDYYLCNGQRDEYPVAWTLPKDLVFECLESFARTGLTPPGISWFNDAGDGNASPNDPFMMQP